LLNQGRVIPIFHCKQCLFIMREAMRLCSDLTGMQPGEVQERLTQLGLMANEHASATALPGSSYVVRTLVSVSDVHGVIADF
jgi:Zn-dependent alcohol dehydrogenase